MGETELARRIGGLEAKVDLVLTGQREAAEREERRDGELGGRVRGLELREARRLGALAFLSAAVSLVVASGADWLGFLAGWRR